MIASSSWLHFMFRVRDEVFIISLMFGCNGCHRLRESELKISKLNGYALCVCLCVLNLLQKSIGCVCVCLCASVSILCGLITQRRERALLLNVARRRLYGLPHWRRLLSQRATFSVFDEKLCTTYSTYSYIQWHVCPATAALCDKARF